MLQDTGKSVDVVEEHRKLVLAEKHAVLELALNLSERFPDYEISMTSLGANWNKYRKTISSSEIHPMFVGQHTAQFLAYLKDRKKWDECLDDPTFQRSLALYVMDKIVHEAVSLGRIDSPALIRHVQLERILRDTRKNVHEAVNKAMTRCAIKSATGEDIKVVFKDVADEIESRLMSTLNTLRTSELN